MNIYAQITINDWFSGAKREWTDIYQLKNVNNEYYWVLTPYSLSRSCDIHTILTKSCKDIEKSFGTHFLFKDEDLENLCPT